MNFARTNLSSMTSLILMMAMVITCCGQAAHAQGTAFTYQGKLDSAGNAVNGNVDLRFTLYAHPLSTIFVIGSPQIVPNVGVVDGVFTVTLDFGASAFTGTNRWLQIDVTSPANGGSGPWTALSPRQQVMPTPYAMHAISATSAGTLAAGTYGNAVSFTNAANSFSGSGAGLTNLNASNISSGALFLSGSSTSNIIRGQNSSTSNNSHGVRGQSTAATGSTYGVHGLSSSVSGRGVYGEAGSFTGETTGVMGASFSPDGRGVYGINTAPTGEGLGVYGVTSSTSGRGVYGLASSASGNSSGVHGESSSTSFATAGVKGIANQAGSGVWGEGFSYGVRGDVTSSSGRGVAGFSSSSSGTTYGVYGIVASTSGTAVYGEADALSGTTYGGYFRASSNAARGVAGFSENSTGTTYGVHGSVVSTSGRAVYGEAYALSGTTYGGYFTAASTAGRAVFAEATAATGTTHAIWATSDSTSGRGIYAVVTAGSGTNYGVAGQTNSASGWGVYSFGNTGASGTKSFRIDHPSDPANKYLQHYSAEGPEPLNIYRGRAVFDDLGEAWIELPSYFQEINRDPLYHLTAIGTAMPDLHVAVEVTGNRFKIAGGKAGASVSWRIEAVRHDAWVRTHGAPVEVLKDDVERGTYQHPELHGQPVERGLMYHPPVQHHSDHAHAQQQK